MAYDKFGNLFYEALGGYYNTLPFQMSNFGNIRALADFYYSSNNGQIFDEIYKGIPVHNDAFDMDYSEATTAEEPDRSSVFWLVQKQLSQNDTTFPQLAFAIKMKGLHQLDAIRNIEL